MTAAPLSLRRFLALLFKEFAQMRADPATLFMGTLLPVILILLFGWGLSMDLNRVGVAAALGEDSPAAQALIAKLRGSPYFEVTTVRSREEAEALLSERRIDAVLDIPPGFAAAAARSDARLGLTIHGVDASAASIIRTYVKAATGLMLEGAALREDLPQTLGTPYDAAAAAAPPSPVAGTISIVSRSWFNEANASPWYLVPGLTIVVLTLSAGFLGSIVIAREWERGTMESLCITPAAPLEIVLSKFLANFALISVGSLLSVLTAALVFEVPLRGSGLLLAAVLLSYTAWAVAFGLFLSALLKNQFVAIQLAVIGSYLPSLMLSGYLFDLRSVPAFISVVGRLMPPTYAIESVKILCLSGGPERLVLSNAALLAACAASFVLLALAATKKRLE
ncbi:ABC transporter permease [uncultured Sutterella sp.]|uniref:ABC transporter permease n=1 Tax=uncultured Sutterella sp. TaxID=286133 RepID=UPI0025DDBA58|nr:ABC transporter permease [uncultured Sutterella sp.]